MQAENNKVVSLTYPLTMDSAEIIDFSDNRDRSLDFIVGVNPTIPGLEKELLRMKIVVKKGCCQAGRWIWIT